jgi:hypothetical protein
MPRDFDSRNSKKLESINREGRGVVATPALRGYPAALLDKLYLPFGSKGPDYPLK